MWLVVLCPVFRMIYGFYIIYEHIDRVEKIASSKLAEQKEPHLCNLGWNNCVYVFNKQNKNFKCSFKDILRRLGQIHSNLYITISDSSKSCSDFSARYWQCISRFPYFLPSQSIYHPDYCSAFTYTELGKVRCERCT